MKVKRVGEYLQFVGAGVLVMGLVVSSIYLEERKKEEIIIEPTPEITATQTPQITPTPIETPQSVVAQEKKTEWYLSDYERSVVEKIVMGEAGGESYEGQVLVAQCILNACLQDNIQPSEVRRSYKYSGWKENVSTSVKLAVSDVFDKGHKITEEPILYFYAPALVDSDWHESLEFVLQEGCHKFFKE